MTETIRAQFVWVTFRDPKSDFCIAVCKQVDDKGKKIGKITIKGDNLLDKDGVTYLFEGYWLPEHPKYGKQFQTTGFLRIPGVTSEDEIVAYLATLKGCGPKTAQRIYDALGPDTPRILNEDYTRLATIKGISKKKADKIKESWDDSKDDAEVYQALAPYGVTIALASKALKEFGVHIWDVINNYPYRLTRLRGFTFPMADMLAKDKGIQADSPERISAAAEYVGKQAELSGHLGVDESWFFDILKKTVNSAAFHALPTDVLQKRFQDVCDDERVLTKVSTPNGKVRIYRTCTRNAEKDVASGIAEKIHPTTPALDLRKRIRDEFKKAGLEPDDNQIDAVETVFKNNFSVITGGPGTGKTTIVKIVKAVQRNVYHKTDICFLAPTGRAARRLSESTGSTASTIHSRLKMFGGDDAGGDALDAQEGISEDVVVVDESSMIDIWVMRELLNAIPVTTRVVMVGDAAQLQSVGCGAVLRDMIDSGAVPIVKLERVFRQCKGSAILENAQRIEDGNTQLVAGKDFEVHDNLANEPLYTAMLDAYVKDVNQYGIFNVVCLMPTRKEVAYMNQRIQERVNPADNTKNEFVFRQQTFREGDIVMELTNSEQVVNGDIGTITKVDPMLKTITVNYYGRIELVYQKEDMERLALAYAMTVHKAQGSEYASVITCLLDYHKHMKIRSIVYTAITRARNICRFYGNYRALQQAVTVDDRGKRQTLLANEIRQAENDWVSCPFIGNVAV